MAGKLPLTDPNHLKDLILDLESGKVPKYIGISNCHIIITPSTDYPELLNLFVIPKETLSRAIIHKREERDIWVRATVEEIYNTPGINSDDITLVTILIPGDEPDKLARFSVKYDSQQVRIRFISALEHLWRDRLRIETTQQRETILENLSAKWGERDEEQFVEPALSFLKDTNLSKEALEHLSDNDSILDSGLTVIYGPGGIGKTHYLRRLAWRYTKRSLKDPCRGIPVFAVLPTLLHQDALENYLARQKGFNNLSLDSIRALIKHHVVIPFLDAFDELVRGAIRDGCREFLDRLGQIMETGGAGVLTSRDYFLYIDPIIPTSLKNYSVAELLLGYFNKQGRRSFIHRKTGLDQNIVARWSKTLEEQVDNLFGSSKSKERDIDGLVGHPLFMEAFCNYIKSIPLSDVALAAENFQFRTPNVFGEIVTRVLERERDKASLGWKAKFGEKFIGRWSHGPFSPEQQMEVLTYISCKISEHKSDNTKKLFGKEWIHGLFDYHAQSEAAGSDLKTLAGRKEALGRVIQNTLGTPEISASISDEESAALKKLSEAEIAEFYLQHTLSDTEPNAPTGLIFATRNRAYFEYFLAKELVNNIYSALSSRDANSVIEWSERHNIFDDFQDCLQFLLWDPRISREGPERLREIFSGEQVSDDTIASYCLSLGLSLLLRRSSSRDNTAFIQGLSFAPDPNWRLELLPYLLPVVSRINLEKVTFPELSIADIELRNITVSNSDFTELRLTNCKLYDVKFESVFCSGLRLGGTITLQNCYLQILDTDLSKIKIDKGTTLHLTDCKLSQTLDSILNDQPQDIKRHISKQRCQVIPDDIDGRELEGLSRGSRFLHKLMNLVRKHGKSSWGVYIFKLRGRTGLESLFDKALDVLIDGKVIKIHSDMIILEPGVDEYMFDGKRRDGRPKIEDYPEFWMPKVELLDALLQERS